MDLLPLSPEFVGEEEAAGEVPDPRRPARKLRLRTRYLRGADVAQHELTVDGGCLRKTLTGDRFVTHGMRPGYGDAGAHGRALYVLDPGGRLLAADAAANAVGAAEWAASRDARDPSQAAELHVPDVIELVQHSSLVAGGPVRCAGELVTDGRGRLLLVSGRSARYRPGVPHLLGLLAHLERSGLPLAGVRVELDGGRLHDAASFVAAGGAPVDFAGVY